VHRPTNSDRHSSSIRPHFGGSPQCGNWQIYYLHGRADLAAKAATAYSRAHYIIGLMPAQLFRKFAGHSISSSGLDHFRFGFRNWRSSPVTRSFVRLRGGKITPGPRVLRGITCEMLTNECRTSIATNEGRPVDRAVRSVHSSDSTKEWAGQTADQRD